MNADGLLISPDYELDVGLFNCYNNSGVSLTREIATQIWENYNRESGFPVFKTISVLKRNHILMSGARRTLLDMIFNVKEYAIPPTLHDIANELHVSTRIASLIKQKFHRSFDSSFRFLNGFNIAFLNLYDLDIEADYLVVDKELVKEIQEKEDNNFNDLFIIRILGILLSKTHGLIGNKLFFYYRFEKRKAGTARWNFCFIIKKEILESLNFELLAHDVSKRLLKIIKADYSIDLESYLAPFKKEGGEIGLNRIVPVVAYILNNEFEVTVDVNQITFPKNR
jgi:hypothetical protein